MKVSPPQLPPPPNENPRTATDFKAPLGLFDAEYLRNGMRYGHSYNGIFIVVPCVHLPNKMRVLDAYSGRYVYSFNGPTMGILIGILYAILKNLVNSCRMNLSDIE